MLFERKRGYEKKEKFMGSKIMTLKNTSPSDLLEVTLFWIDLHSDGKFCSVNETSGWLKIEFDGEISGSK